VPIVSVVSLKGGVGKTSAVLGLAGASLSKKLRTVVVDLDPQGHATTVLDPVNVQFTANDVLVGSYSGRPRDALATSGWGDQIRLLASGPGLEHRNHTDGAASEHRLRTAITKLKDADIILIDTPPSLAELTRNALAASDLALVVTEPTMFALSATQQALTAIDAIRRGFNLRLRPAGIIVNRFHSNSAEHRYRLDELRAAYPGLALDPVLPDRSAVTQAQGACVPVQRWPTPGARDIARTCSKYLDQLLISAHTGSDGPFAKESGS
jgi:cellulose biosynthesis protein BcsQ